MSFTHPVVLVALVVPALLLVWVWRRRGRSVVLPFDHARPGPGAGPGAGAAGLLRFPVDMAESLPALVLAVTIVILAGPQKLAAPKTRRALTNIEFCVDISGSMTARFGGGTRYDASMEAIGEFLDYREGDAFGLTFFGNSVLHWVPLTSDTSAIRNSPPFMKPGRVPPWFGGTEIGKALLACKDVLTSREEGDRMIILVSDGFSWDLGGGQDMKIIQALKQNDIVVYAIHIADSEVPGPIVNITSHTGGEVFNPGDPVGLKTVFKRIDEMRKAPLEAVRPETMDDFAAYCLAALSLIGAHLLALFGLRYTPW